MTSQLLAHFPFASDTHDHSPNRLPAESVDVALGEVGPHGKPNTAARFNGRSSVLRVASREALNTFTDDFTLSAWVCTDRQRADVVGDIASRFDPDKRNGWQLSIVTNGGVTSTSQSNHRHLHFGIDDARVDPTWQDCGRPGDACFVTALCGDQGRLYCTTAEQGLNQSGGLWCYAGGQQWTKLGNPMGCNAMHAVAAFEGDIYCGLTRYNMHGSRLGDTLNKIPGGKVFRWRDGEWTDCGHPGHEDAVPESQPDRARFNTGKADDAMCLTAFNGSLYCTSNHRTGAFRYEGGTTWKNVGPDHRIIALTVWRGQLYALLNGGPVLCYDADGQWTDCGRPGDSTQTYGAAIHRGKLLVGTWPVGTVQQYDGGTKWSPVHGAKGWVGYEAEIMAMALYNGKVYLGGLPMANVYRIDAGDYAFMGNLDNSQVVLRRVWSMAVYDGALYAGTLPSGRVMRLQAGAMATWDQTFPGGWHQVVAVRDGCRLAVYVDGKLVSRSSGFTPGQFQLNNAAPLLVGMGMHDHFDGLLSDVRVYRGVIDPREIAAPSRNDA